jgi:hypothetical protein
MQPINAQIQSKGAPDILFAAGASPDKSKPSFLGDQGLDPILEIAAEIYVPIGREKNRWLGSGEFSNIINRWNTIENCYGNGGDAGLTLETSFGDDTALIMLRTNEKHPQLGEGLLATLQIPFFREPLVIANECAGLNLPRAGVPSVNGDGIPLTETDTANSFSIREARRRWWFRPVWLHRRWWGGGLGRPLVARRSDSEPVGRPPVQMGAQEAAPQSISYYKKAWATCLVGTYPSLRPACLRSASAAKRPIAIK